MTYLPDKELSPKGQVDNRKHTQNCPDQITGEAGFTLVEVMIASVIMAFVLVSTIAVVSHASVYLADLRLRVSSSQILQQRVEDLRAMNWAQVSVCPTTFANAGDTNGTFSGFVNISPYQTFGAATTVMQATVTVTWTNRHNRVVSNQLTTLISNGGINKTTL
jgi:prepilin-type N-terminal cleavage/methylation domain-containing protein